MKELTDDQVLVRCNYMDKSELRTGGHEQIHFCTGERGRVFLLSQNTKMRSAFTSIFLLFKLSYPHPEEKPSTGINFLRFDSYKYP